MEDLKYFGLNKGRSTRWLGNISLAIEMRNVYILGNYSNTRGPLRHSGTGSQEGPLETLRYRFS
jgi:hypothetical protein